MRYFAAYLDILGTKDLVARGKFSDLHVLDFCGAASVAAHRYRVSRFAAFSDCVIFTTPADKPQDLIGILVLLYENWINDGILARGGIALGSAIWVDHEINGKTKRPPNFNCARIYGEAISTAVEIERSSGPGILPFASDEVADAIAEVDSSSVLRLSSNVLRSFEWEKLGALIGYLEVFLEHETCSQAKRHLQATKRVLHLFEQRYVR